MVATGITAMTMTIATTSARLAKLRFLHEKCVIKYIYTDVRVD